MRARENLEGHGPKLDQPIDSATEDFLDRRGFAEHFVSSLLSHDHSQGLVFAVTGPWGAGKTSFLKLVQSAIEDRQNDYFLFNPWLFTGAENLISIFFQEVGRQVRYFRHSTKAGSSLISFGNFLMSMGRVVPTFGTAWDLPAWATFGIPTILAATVKLWGRIRGHRHSSLSEQKNRLEMQLKKLQKPLIIAIDDVDRLSNAEIAEIFRLVRLVGNLPNVVYLLAFDRLRVEQALTDLNFDGRRYVEKIVLATVDLPEISRDTLQEQTRQELEALLKIHGVVGVVNDGLLPHSFHDILKPQIKNLRDMRRYLSALHFALPVTRGKVAVADVIALEGIRAFLPDLFAEIRTHAGLLTGSLTPTGSSEEESRRKQQIADLVNKHKDHKVMIESFLRVFFPACRQYLDNTLAGDPKTWFRQRRVAHPQILKYYLEKVTGEQLQHLEAAESMLAVLADEEELSGLLNLIPDEDLEDRIGALELFSEDFTIDQIRPGVVALANCLERLPDRPLGMFRFAPTITVGRVLLRLFWKAGSSESVETMLPEILARVPSLFARRHIIQLVGHMEGAGHGLVREEYAEQLQSDWAGEFLYVLNEAEELPKMDLEDFLDARKWIPGGPQSFKVPDRETVNVALFLSSRGHTVAQPLDSYTEVRTPYTYFKELVLLLGTRSEVERRFRSVRGQLTQMDTEIAQLIENALRRPANSGASEDTADDSEPLDEAT